MALCFWYGHGLGWKWAERICSGRADNHWGPVLVCLTRYKWSINKAALAMDGKTVSRSANKEGLQRKTSAPAARAFARGTIHQALYFQQLVEMTRLRRTSSFPMDTNHLRTSVQFPAVQDKIHSGRTDRYLRLLSLLTSWLIRLHGAIFSLCTLLFKEIPPFLEEAEFLSWWHCIVRLLYTVFKECW